jgi:hypothetical protein
MDAMDAIEILKAEHKAVKGTMVEIVRSVDGNRRILFAAFRRELELHDSIERDVFYPSINTNPKTFGVQGMDTETRRAVAKAMRNLNAMPVESPDWFPYFKAIQGILGRQMDTEEFTVFERVKDALPAQELDELGRRMVYERHQRLASASGAAPQRLPSRSAESNGAEARRNGPTTY